MGTGYDCFDPRAHTLDSRITGRPHRNRLLLRDTLDDAGFDDYANEWWHFTLRGERYPIATSTSRSPAPRCAVDAPVGCRKRGGQTALSVGSVQDMDDWVLWLIAAVVFGVGEIATLSFFLAPVRGRRAGRGDRRRRSAPARSSAGRCSSSSR